MAQTSPYQVLAVEESDTPEMADVEARAFENSEISIVVFGSRGPGMKEYRSQRFKQIMAEDRTMRFTKVVVDGKIVGFAQWNLHLDPNWHLEDEKKREKEKEAQQPSGVNKEAMDEFFGWLLGVRRRRMGGQKHLLLALLVVVPEFQGRGVGSLLIRDGLAVAAEHNIPVWLESSPRGYPVYKKLGFQDVEVFDMDLTKYGGETIDRSVGMIRPEGTTTTANSN